MARAYARGRGCVAAPSRGLGAAHDRASWPPRRWPLTTGPRASSARAGRRAAAAAAGRRRPALPDRPRRGRGGTGAAHDAGGGAGHRAGGAGPAAPARSRRRACLCRLSRRRSSRSRPPTRSTPACVRAGPPPAAGAPGLPRSPPAMSLVLLAAAVPVALTNDDAAQVATTDSRKTTRATTTHDRSTTEPQPERGSPDDDDAGPSCGRHRHDPDAPRRARAARPRPGAPRPRRGCRRRPRRPATTPAGAADDRDPRVVARQRRAPRRTRDGARRPLDRLRAWRRHLDRAGRRRREPDQHHRHQRRIDKPGLVARRHPHVFARPGGLYTVDRGRARRDSALARRRRHDRRGPRRQHIAFVRGGNIFTSAPAVEAPQLAVDVADAARLAHRGRPTGATWPSRGRPTCSGPAADGTGINDGARRVPPSPAGAASGRIAFASAWATATRSAWSNPDGAGTSGWDTAGGQPAVVVERRRRGGLPARPPVSVGIRTRRTAGGASTRVTDRPATPTRPGERPSRGNSPRNPGYPRDAGVSPAPA